MYQFKRQTGFTLLELMVAIAIVGILIALAGPNFSRALAKGSVNDVVAEWRESFYFAQSEAMRLQNNVQLCASNDGATCNGDSFADGWIVMEQSNNYVLRDIPKIASSNLTITSSNNRNTYTFNGAGRLTGFVGDTLTFALSGKEDIKQTLTLNTEGRIR